MSKTLIKKLIRFIPAIIWMVVIFSFSSRPTISLSNSVNASFFIYKSFHLVEYALLLILLFIAVKDIKYAIIFTYIYAMSDEFHQTYISGRTGCIRDTLIDLIGITIGVILVIFFKKKIRLLIDNLKLNL